MSGQDPKKSRGKDGGKDGGGARAAGSLLGARAMLSRQLGSAASPGRLPSIRPARDLTLGGTPKVTLGGAVKRTFTPNIPTRRIKEEPKDTPLQDRPNKSKREGRGRGGHKNDRGGGRGRGRGRGRPEVVASSSIFSMGPADKQRAGHIAASTGFAGGPKGDLKRTTTIKKENKSEPYDDEETKRILSMLNTENEDGDEEGQEFGMAPVQIPLAQYRLRQESSTSCLPDQIKDEPMDIDSEEKEIKRPIKPKPVIPKSVLKSEESDISCSTLFSSGSEGGQEKLMFFQFPDKLPIKPIHNAEPMNTDQAENDKELKQDKSNKKLSLLDVTEGYIGKLQVMKSGKVRLVLGDVTLDVAMGTSCSFLQDLVSIHSDEQRSDMTVLGHLKHRLICTPDYERLLSS